MDRFYILRQRNAGRPYISIKEKLFRYTQEEDEAYRFQTYEMAKKARKYLRDWTLDIIEKQYKEQKNG